MKAPRVDESGQILIPGIAAFLGLLVVFMALVASGVRCLVQMRMDMAAQAAALSAARAEADELNNCAAHNLTANLFVNLRWGGYGAMEAAAVDSFNLWLESEKVFDKLSLLHGMEGYPIAVGQRVAQMNGSTLPVLYFPRPWPIHLDLRDLKIFIVYGDLPFPIPVTFPGVYYTRQWGPAEAHPQPPHKITWLAGKGHLYGIATAGVYLDERDDTFLNNGGFPRAPADESLLRNFEFQSFYPQFNARLVKTARPAQLLQVWRSLVG